MGFRVWHADFPGSPESPHLSPRVPGRAYDRTPRQALESIVRKLQGNCSRDAWLMSKDFFNRADPEDARELVAALDRGLQVPEMADLVENVVQALGRMHAPQAGAALLRALEHPRQAIRNEAMLALIGCGTPDTLRAARSMFRTVDGRGMHGWIRAARRHLPAEELVADFRAILADDQLALVWRFVVESTLELPPRVAVQVFEPMIGHEPPELAATIAGLRHAAGDTGGTSLIVDLLRRREPQARLAAVKALQLGGVEDVLDDVMRLTTDPDPGVRLAVVQLLATLPSERVSLALETMAVDEAQDVRRAALAALVARGRRQALDEIVETVRTASGSRLVFALEDLVAARDGGAVPVMVERMRGAPPGERRDFLRTIALTTSAAAFAPLRDVFLADDPFARENRDYTALLLANCHGAETDILQLLRALPKSDYARRAMLMRTVANVAADRESPLVAAPAYALFRELLADRAEIPQLRLLALEFLRRDLRLDDMSTIKRLLADEEDPMRMALTDFLFEFY